MTMTDAVALRALSMVDMAAANTPEMTTPAMPALHFQLEHTIMGAAAMLMTAQLADIETKFLQCMPIAAQM